MGTVLFTYEFGAGLGHLTPLLAVAERLASHHRLVFALRDVDHGAETIRRALGERAEVRQGVRWRPPEKRRGAARTLADALWNAGFADRDKMAEVVREWGGLVDELRPDLLVADFAPGLRLATLGRVPMIEVGYGYTTPPQGRLLPPLRPWDPRVPAMSRAKEFQLLAWANAARAAVGGPPVDHLADLFHGDETFVCTLPELDPYAAYRDSSTGPLVPSLRPGPAFSERSGPEVYAYLHGNHPQLKTILQALTLSDRDAAVYISGVPAETVASLCGRRIRVYRKPADYAAVLPQAKLVIHHGGLGTAHTALAAATPQLMFPVRLEWQTNARGVELLGAGRVGDPTATREALARQVSTLLENTGLQAGAVSASIRLHDALRQDPVGLIAAACEWRLRGGHAAPEPERV